MGLSCHASSLYSHPDNPYAVTHVQDAYGAHYNFHWDDKGNMVHADGGKPYSNRQLCWTEDNRLQAFMERGDEGGIAAYYNYSADGERNFKLTSPRLNIQQNASLFNNPPLLIPTLYASPLITLTPKGYTKHYFEEGRRICSKLGGGFRGRVLAEDILKPVEEIKYNYEEQHNQQRQGVHETFGKCIGAWPELIKRYDLLRMILEYRSEGKPFFYHSDHLGSAAYLTSGGHVTQTLNYLPYGEDWIDVQNNMDPRLGQYRFNGKEKDYESGFHYYGARYYWSEVLTGWLSVDPMADKYPSISPYAYCAWNPVKLVDPDGREIHIVGDKKYQSKVIALLNQLAKSGLAGKYLVSEALRSEKTFTFIQPRDNSSFEEDAINRNGKNGEISFILFDAYSSGTFDEANGGVEKTPLTTVAHELAHFVFPNNGHILKDNGYNGGPAGEVKAVEWENMVRADLGMPLRRKYAGMDVFGKEISPSKQYENFYTLTKKENYMQRPKDAGGFRASRENLKHISPYYAGGRIVNPPINSTECKFKL